MQGCITILEDGDKVMALFKEGTDRGELRPIGYPTLWDEKTLESVFVSSNFDSLAVEKGDMGMCEYPRFAHKWIGTYLS